MWLEADMLIRGATNNAKSLDDFARAFFGGREGDWGQDTYNFDDVVAALNAVHPYDWTTFLHERMRTSGRPAPTGGIERAGYRLVWRAAPNIRSEEHTSELQSLMRISYAVFCLKKKQQNTTPLINSGHLLSTQHTQSND